jgi:uncharacterized protein (DUF302 family)
MNRLAAICSFSLLLAARATPAPVAAEAAPAAAAVVATASARGFEETLAAVKAGAEKRGFTVFSVIDHAAGAAAAGETLRPMTLVIFGNPKGGAPLMRAAPTIGIDLPLKALAYEDAAAGVVIATPDIDWLFDEHGLVGLEAPKAKVRAALAAIAARAAAPGDDYIVGRLARIAAPVEKAPLSRSVSPGFLTIGAACSRKRRPFASPKGHAFFVREARLRLSLGAGGQYEATGTLQNIHDVKGRRTPQR